MTKRLFLLTLLALSSFPMARGGDWPQWRGPGRDDLSRETGLLESWPANGPPQVWLYRDCGIGYSGPAVVDDQIFIMGARRGTEYLLSLDAKTAREVWAAPLGPELENNWGNGPRGTPTVVGRSVYALSATGNLVCVERATGEVIWSKTMQALGGNVPSWGYCESPLVHDGRVICTPGGAQGAIAALDARNGEVVWQTADLTPSAHYSSPVLVERQKRLEVVQLLATHLTGVDFATGRVNWQVSWPGQTAVVPTPIVRGPYVYATSGYGVGSMLVEIGRNYDVTEVYRNRVMKNQHGGAILLGDHVYGYSDGVGWVCQDLATGQRVWREREALGKGAIAYADGRFYCLAENSGEVVLIAASPAGWQEHGRFTLEPQTNLRKDSGKIWTHPVISGGRLYLRDQDLLFCFDVSDHGRQTTARKK